MKTTFETAEELDHYLDSLLDQGRDIVAEMPVGEVYQVAGKSYRHHEYLELYKGEVKPGEVHLYAHKLVTVAEGESDWGDDADLCQFTTCGGCGTALTSWSKSAECPVCKKDCYLT